MRKIWAALIAMLATLPAGALADGYSIPAHSMDAARMRYGTVGLLAAFFLGAALLLRRWLVRYGVKRDVAPSGDPEALDGLDAAVAEALVKNRVDESGFSATLLELVQRGALTMSGEVHPSSGERQARFAVANRQADLTDQQRALFDWLFAGREFLWIGDLDAGGDAALAQDFAGGYGGWQRAVTAQAAGQGLYHGNRAKLGCGAAMLIAAGLLISAALFVLGQAALGLAGLGLAAAVGFGFSRVRSLTDLGERKLAAARGFCEQYGEGMAELPPEALKHLPLLVGLGYAEPLARSLDRRADQPDCGYGGILPAWWYAGWCHDVDRVGRSFQEVRQHNQSVASKGSGASGGGGSSGSPGGGGARRGGSR